MENNQVMENESEAGSALPSAVTSNHFCRFNTICTMSPLNVVCSGFNQEISRGSTGDVAEFQGSIRSSIFGDVF